MRPPRPAKPHSQYWLLEDGYPRSRLVRARSFSAGLKKKEDNNKRRSRPWPVVSLASFTASRFQAPRARPTFACTSRPVRPRHIPRPVLLTTYLLTAKPPPSLFSAAPQILVLPIFEASAPLTRIRPFPVPGPRSVSLNLRRRQRRALVSSLLHLLRDSLTMRGSPLGPVR